MKLRIVLPILALAFSGCGLVSSSYITSKADPRNPIARTAKIWLFVPDTESLDERIVRAKIEDAMRGLNYNLVPRLADSEYILGFEVKDAPQNIPSATGGPPLTIVARDIHFSIMKAADYLPYLQTKKEPPILWEGFVGLNLKSFEAYGDKAIRELFTRFPNNASETVTLGPRVW